MLSGKPVIGSGNSLSILGFKNPPPRKSSPKSGSEWEIKNREFLNPIEEWIVMDCPRRSSTCTKHALEGTISDLQLWDLRRKMLEKSPWKIKVGQKRRDPGHARRTARFGGPVGHFLSLQEFTFDRRNSEIKSSNYKSLPDSASSQIPSHHPNPKISWSCCAVVHLEPQVSLHSVTTSS